MIHASQGSRLFRCAICACWESSSLSDVYTYEALEIEPRCSGCATHAAWWGSHGERVGAWHGYWPQNATRGMELGPRGFLYWPEGMAPSVPAWNRETVVAALTKQHT